MDQDIVIVGAGFAGLTAALRACELGLRVTLLEAGNGESYVCNSRYSGGHLAICMDDPAKPLEYLTEKFFATTDGVVAPSVADALLRNARTVLDWLRGHGVQFIRIGNDPGRQWVMAPPRPGQPGLDWKGRGPDVTMRRLTAKLKEHGTQILMNARATRLLTENGRCAGIEFEQDGVPKQVRSRAVILADGGFQSNEEYLRRYVTRHPDKVMQRNSGTGRGDALRMAESMGARLVQMEHFYGHPLSRDAFTNPMLWPHPYLDTMVVLGVVVGQAGTRFVDEGRGGVYVANQLARRDDPLDAIVIFDDAVWQGPAKDIGAPPTPNPSLERAGATIHTAGTIAELAQAAGIDGERLTRTVEEFNKAAAGGTLGALAPARTTSRFMPAPIAKPPFRAIPMCAGITYTMGGPEIDSATRVLNGDGHPMEGLHAIGSATGGVEGGPHSGYVGGLGKAFILGYRAAEVIAGKVPA